MRIFFSSFGGIDEEENIFIFFRGWEGQEGVGSPKIISSSSLKDVPVISCKDFFSSILGKISFFFLSKKNSSSPYENFSSFCQKKRIKYSSSSSLRGVVIFNYIFLFLSMNRKIFSSFYFSIMKVKELFLVNPHDHSTPPIK